jgi:predicted nucleic acid-binding protein
MADVLVDTDVFIDLLRGARTLVAGPDRVSYSIVTRAELFAGRSDEREMRIFLGGFTEVGIDDAIAERAGRLRRETALELSDALIAATALEHKLTLVTRNRRDFDRVRGLKVRSPA